MSDDRKSVQVSLPLELVNELDALVDQGVFGSRSEALQYSARLIVREEDQARCHGLTDDQARDDVLERLKRKRKQ